MYFSLSETVTCQYARVHWARTSCEGCAHEYGRGTDETPKGFHFQFRDRTNCDQDGNCDEALLIPPKIEATHTGWAVPITQLSYYGHGVVGEYYGPLTVTADFGTAVTLSGWLTDSIPAYEVEYSYDRETWLPVHVDRPVTPPLPPGLPPSAPPAQVARVAVAGNDELPDRTEVNAKLHNATAPEWLALPEELRACAERYSQGQYGEELALLPHLQKIAGLGGGTFVEIGAYNGITFSNTIALENCLGWRGLLIEGNPHNCQTLERNMPLRTKSVSVCSAVCDQEKGIVNFTVAGGNVAGMPDTMDEGFMAGHSDRNMAEGTVQVGCTRMHNLMKDHAQLEQADFLSLDVEGGEEFVLQASNLKDFKMMLVETGADIDKYDRASAEAVAKRERIINMLAEQGFVKPTEGILSSVATIFSNEMFIRADVLRLLKLAERAAMTTTTKAAEFRHNKAALNAIHRPRRQKLR